MWTREIATLTLLLLAACGQESTSPPVGGETPELPADQILDGLRHNMTRDGLRVAVLNADTAYLYESGTRFDLVGVRLDFHGETGAQTGHLTSLTGEYDTQEEQFVARGDVVLITESPEGERRLETEELFYNVPGDRLWSDSSFVMTEGARVTRGSSFQSDGRFGTWQVQGGTTEGGLPAEGGISF